MASTEERIRQLVDENLEIDGRPIGRPLSMDTSLSDAGVSSVEMVSFGKVISHVFNITISPEDCAEMSTVGDLIQLIDSRTA